MAHVARLLPLAGAVLSVAAYAQEQPSRIDVPAAPIADALRELGRQGRASIGFHDPRVARLRLRGVRGRFTVAQALERMLAGTGASVRRVAPSSYLIEITAAPVPTRPVTIRRSAAPPPELPTADIVVTATKRDIPLSVYPGGVEIVDGGRLSFADSARGTGAIEARVASVASTHLGPGRNKLFIRGIADSSFVGPTQATVGQYWGNSRVTYNAPDPSLRLYDVRSIEVLEGPQGTLYGAGSLGGVVRIVPQSPDLGAIAGQMWGGAKAVAHGRPGADGGAILNLPLIDDRLALRALAFGAIDGGYIDDRQRGLQDVNRVRTVGGRAALRFTPGDDWTIDLSGLGQRIVGDDSQYADRSTGGLIRSSAIAQPFHNDYWLADVVVGKRWGSIEWTSSMGYARQSVVERFEGRMLSDPGAIDILPDLDTPAAAFTQDNRIRMLTAETRLARRDAAGTGWVIGASVLHNRADVAREMNVSGVRLPLTGVRNTADEQTLYGEATVAPLARLTVTLGGRLTRSQLDGSAADAAPAIALRIDANAADGRAETRALPSAALAYRPTDRLTLFARYQQGFRPGGIAVRRDFIQRFAGDRVFTSEAGARYRTGALDSSISVSWTRWHDIQADLIDGYSFPTTANIGDGRILSIGWATRWRPLPGLDLDAALYLNDSRLVAPDFEVLPFGSRVVDQRRLPNVADASGRIGFGYRTPLRGSESINVSGYARYIGRSTLGIGPILGRLQGRYVDTALEVRIGSPRRGVSLAAANLLDTRGNRFALGSSFLLRDRDQITPLEPRSVRLGVDLAF